MYQADMNDQILIGYDSKLSESCKVIFSGQGRLVIRDNVIVEDSTRIIIGDHDVLIDSWSTIHANCTLIGGQGLHIGQHCWIGQNTVLDGTGHLTIENGVRIGLYSQIWTHVAAGELIEGCRLFSKKPTHISKDVWLVGSCFVGAGVTIGEKTVCMSGSRILKGVGPRMTVKTNSNNAENFCLYKPVSLEQKYTMLKNWAQEFADNYDALYTEESESLMVSRQESIVHIFPSFDQLILDKMQSSTKRITIAFVDAKTYAPCFSELEKEFIKWLSGNKARFYPLAYYYHTKPVPH